MPGHDGTCGNKGDRGPVGAPGEKGANGPHGPKGGKGEPAQVPQRNWKQCAWKDVNDGRDYGLIKVTKIGSIQKPDKVLLNLRETVSR